MKKRFFTKLAVFALSAGLIFAAEKNTDGDDIFRSVKAESTDFYKLSVEPSKKEIMAGVQSQLADIKKQRMKLIQDANSQKKSIRDTLNSNKKEIADARTQLQKDLAEQRASVYGQPKKKTTIKKSPAESTEKKQTPVQTKTVETVVTKKDDTTSTVAIKKEETRLENSENIRSKFINYGLGLQGIRYVYGGTTPNPGMDCSGFVQYTAKNSVGVELPRTAQSMYNAAAKISAEEAVPGDLVFFNDGRKVSHVGIYLGNNQTDNEFRKGKIFLNAASGGPRTGVVVSGMNEPYWKRTFYGYGRILPKM